MKTLKFSPYAWRKMHFLRDIGDTEVSFMGVTSQEQLNVIIDVQMVKQYDSSGYTMFDPEGLADFFDDMVDLGYQPEQFGRIWCHTHPGNSAHPSGTDTDTFKREFSGPNWAVMFILAKDSSWTCRLRHKVHPDLINFIGDDATQEQIEVAIDWTAYCPTFNTPDVEGAWKAEYEKHWNKYIHPVTTQTNRNNYQRNQTGGYLGGNQYWQGSNFRENLTASDLYTAGWRWNNKKWSYRTDWANEDKQKCRAFSPDSFMGFASKMEWQAAGSPSYQWLLDLLDRSRGNKTPLSQYKAKGNNHHKPLSQVDSGLTADRNLLNDQDDGNFEWLAENQKPKVWSYWECNLEDPKLIIKNVLARDADEAINFAHLHIEAMQHEKALPKDITEISVSDNMNQEMKAFEEAFDSALDEEAEDAEYVIDKEGQKLLPDSRTDDTELEVLPTQPGLADFVQMGKNFKDQKSDTNPYNDVTVVTDGFDVLG